MQTTLQSITLLVAVTVSSLIFSHVQTKDIYYVTGEDMISVTCGTGEGWYRNPFDCNKFYACVSTNIKDYFVYDYDCPEGLHYDLNRTMCDYPWEVKPKCDVVDIPTTTRRPFKLPPPRTPEPKYEEVLPAETTDIPEEPSADTANAAVLDDAESPAQS